jgi:hypothetical protein
MINLSKFIIIMFSSTLLSEALKISPRSLLLLFQAGLGMVQYGWVFGMV